jgi:hypothetical protein
MAANQTLSANPAALCAARAGDKIASVTEMSRPALERLRKAAVHGRGRRGAFDGDPENII